MKNNKLEIYSWDKETIMREFKDTIRRTVIVSGLVGILLGILWVALQIKGA